jgi:hypothetical protein
LFLFNIFLQSLTLVLFTFGGVAIIFIGCILWEIRVWYNLKDGQYNVENYVFRKDTLDRDVEKLYHILIGENLDTMPHSSFSSSPYYENTQYKNDKRTKKKTREPKRTNHNDIKTHYSNHSPSKKSSKKSMRAKEYKTENDDDSQNPEDGEDDEKEEEEENSDNQRSNLETPRKDKIDETHDRKMLDTNDSILGEIPNIFIKEGDS